MTRVKLFLVIDVAEFGGSLTASQHALLSARVLAACHWSAFNLTWAYKLVNTSVAPRVFEAALHDACTSSLTGLSRLVEVIPRGGSQICHRFSTS